MGVVSREGKPAFSSRSALRGSRRLWPGRAGRRCESNGLGARVPGLAAVPWADYSTVRAHNSHRVLTQVVGVRPGSPFTHCIYFGSDPLPFQQADTGI